MISRIAAPVVKRVLRDEIERGRVERDQLGRVRLVPGALPTEVVQALAGLA